MENVRLTDGLTPAYIGLGSNLDSDRGGRARLIELAIEALGGLGRVSAVSSVYETKAWCVPDEQPDYLNQVVLLETTLPPEQLMTALLEIESRLGRTRTTRHASRTIDLDLLLSGDTVLDSTSVQIPHPRMHQRAFVLVPLAEIAPGAVHPVLGVTVAELAERVDRSGIRLFSRPS